MRRVTRSQLDATTLRKLHERQSRADRMKAQDELDVTSDWEAARKTKPLATVLSNLKAMAGSRERCMYCVDSHGTDIEHFWPKSVYPEKMYRWQNHLLSCTACGRIKGIQFPLWNGAPSLIDPTAEEPWQQLDFDPITGNLTARYNPDTGAWSERGKATVETLRLDRREALARGHLRTFHRLCNRVETFLVDSTESVTILLDLLREDDDHGLLGWCVYGDGGSVEPFCRLRQHHPDVWAALDMALQHASPPETSIR